MITYVVGDLFQSPARVLVNTVNTVGAMGKGLAAEFKRCYPEMFDQYKRLCDAGQFQVGQLWLYKTPHKWILNFPTKQDWRDPSLVEYIEAGLQKFTATYAEKGIASISFPLLGCGLGGLDWETQVRPLMEGYLRPLPIDVFIHLHDPNNPFAPPQRDPEAIRRWLRGEPQPPGAAQFVDDVAAVIGSGITLTMLDGQTTFEATIDRQEKQVTLRLPEETVLIGESILVELWHYLRAAGYAHPQYFPGGLHRVAPAAVALLTQLPYVRPILLASEDTPDARQVGLHLLAPLTTETPIHRVEMTR